MKTIFTACLILLFLSLPVSFALAGDNVYTSPGTVTALKASKIEVTLPDSTKDYIVKCNFLETKEAGKGVELFLKLLPDGEDKTKFATLFEAAAAKAGDSKKATSEMSVTDGDGKAIGKSVKIGKTTISPRSKIKVPAGTSSIEVSIKLTSGKIGTYYLVVEED